MRIENFFDNFAKGTVDLHNQFFLNTDAWDLDSNIPLMTADDWRRNHHIGLSSAVAGLSTYMISLIGLVGFVSYSANSISNCIEGDNMSTLNAGYALAGSLLFAGSRALSDGLIEQVKTIQAKRENKYNVPEEYFF